MKEGEVIFECGVGRYIGPFAKSKNEWIWRARGYRLEEFCCAYEPSWTPFDPIHEGWVVIGPFKSERQALLDLKRFEKAYQEFLQIKVTPAPDPCLLN
jgi:hypothetical protein